MHNNVRTVRSKAVASPFAIVLASVIVGIFPHALASSAMAQALSEPPRHVTPWTPMPVPWLRSTAPALVPSISLSSKNWTPIGPAPLAGDNHVSGRITGIASDPMDADTIYVSAAGGGVWKTTNGGTSWTRLTDEQKTLSMGAIAIGTRQRHRDDDEDNDENKGEDRDKKREGAIVYAGTGEANNSGDSNFGRGILVSTDGGAHWKLFTGPSNAFDRLTTSQIAVDPTNARVAYAAMADSGANGLFGNTGIWKTSNAGKTWTNTTASIDSSSPWSAVVIDPHHNRIVYAAVGSIFGADTNGVYKSIDGGGTWTLLTNGPKGSNAGRIAIAVSPSNSQILYVIAAASFAPGGFGTLYKIMRSDNGGNTFTDLTGGTPNFMGGQGWYDLYVIVDPSNSAIVYVAGAAGTNSILRSTNSGVSWTDISFGGASPHADHHASAFDANGKLLDGDDGGIYRLDNTTATFWTDLNGNLETIQFQGIGLHPTDRNKAIGGSQDNGTEIFTGNLVWTETEGGDGGFAKFSQTNGNRAYHQIPVASFGSNFFRRSDDGGDTWITKTSGIDADLNDQNFYAPFVVDPGNGDRVLYGTANVWETTDGGDSWIALTTFAHNGWSSSGVPVDAIGLAPSHANTIYASVNGGQIFVTTDHGASWVEKSIPGNPSVNDLQVDSGNPQIVYAVINRFSAGGTVFRTTNGGTTWTNISGNLPNEPVWSLQIGEDNGTLYVGADDGVYATTDFGVSWSRFGTGFPHAQVFQIELNRKLHILGAGTHGRGMWEIGVEADTRPAP
jgi:photosystem II stability/assembly factor-like uncharacterized protein